MKLYKISDEIRAIMDAADPDTGELMDTQFDNLDALELEFSRKAESVAFIVREQEAEAVAIKAEAKRLTDAARVRANTATRLKAYLLEQLQAQGIQKIKGDILTVRRQNSAASVQIDSMGSVPAEYFVTPDPVLSKALIKDAINDGEDVPGACLVQNEHIRIC